MAEQELLAHRRQGGLYEGYTTTVARPPLAAAQVRQLAQAFGLVRPQVFVYNHGYRNHSFGLRAGGQQYNLMLFKRELEVLPRIQRADAVAAAAGAGGLPTRQLADPRTLKVAVAGGFRLARLYHWLAGETIPWEAYTRKHLKTLGRTMAALHLALASSQIRLPSALDELERQNSQMAGYFARQGVKMALERKLQLRTRHDHARIARFLTSEALRRLPCQPLHLDFVRGNILWQGPEISGIIDFEKTAAGPTVIDLARTYAFLLVDCPKTRAEVQRSFLKCYLGAVTKGRFEADAGVNCEQREQEGARAPRRFRPKIDPLWQLLEAFTNYFLIYDFYKFLAHNPYESLLNNYHFCRTRDILLTRNILEEL